MEFGNHPAYQRHVLGSRLMSFARGNPLLLREKKHLATLCPPCLETLSKNLVGPHVTGLENEIHRLFRGDFKAQELLPYRDLIVGSERHRGDYNFWLEYEPPQKEVIRTLLHTAIVSGGETHYRPGPTWGVYWNAFNVGKDIHSQDFSYSTSEFNVAIGLPLPGSPGAIFYITWLDMSDNPGGTFYLRFLGVGGHTGDKVIPPDGTKVKIKFGGPEQVKELVGPENGNRVQSTPLVELPANEYLELDIFSPAIDGQKYMTTQWGVVFIGKIWEDLGFKDERKHY